MLKTINAGTHGGVSGFWHAEVSTDSQQSAGVSNQHLLVQLADLSLHYYKSG